MEGLHTAWVEEFLSRALEEDLGGYGDITSEALFPPGIQGVGRFEAREDGVLAGGPLLPILAARMPLPAEVELLVEEGGALEAGQAFARARGPVRTLLTMERVGLNVVGRMSGVATLTARYVAAAEGRVDVLDTRKTTPLHRPLQKYAVRMGGGRNHRLGLFDAAMIKDNHRMAAGMSLGEAIGKVRDRLGHTQTMVVEVESLEGAREAAAAGAHVILLDNMGPDALREVAAELAGSVRLEASGGITLESLPEISRTGVHAVSAGALTHSARTLDVAFELEEPTS